MKNLIFALIISFSSVIFGCSNEISPETTEKIDVDLTKLSPTMIYAEVFNILQAPNDYRGKILKIRGKYLASHDPQKDEIHHACVIYDATACCMQGFEFELAENQKYPPNQCEITLIGRFDTYKIQKIDNPILRDAKIDDWR